MHVLDEHRGEIFLRYIAEDMKREDVQKLLVGRGVNVTDSQLRDKLRKWEYRKNTTRAEARSIVLGFSEHLRQRPESSHHPRRRPTNAIERADRFYSNHRREYRLLLHHAKARNQYGESQHNSGPLERPLRTPSPLRATSKFQHDLDDLIHQSFHTKAWMWQGNGLLIVSSPNTAAAEKVSIMRMIHGVDHACDAARYGHRELAQDRLYDAFEAVDHLVSGQYHDNIPNILAKINDLNDNGLHHEAMTMKQRVTKAIQTSGNSNETTKMLYDGFKDIELEHLGDLEECCGILIEKDFEQYLGKQCYSRFVMEMNSARRRLTRNPQLRLEDVLPCRFQLDAEFGETNCRPLDVLRIRIETLYQRVIRSIPAIGTYPPEQDAVYYQIKREAEELIGRAGSIVNDPWKHNYFLIKGHYYAGLAHYYFGEYEDARMNLRCVLDLDEVFRAIDRSGQFDGEATYIRGILSDPYMNGGSSDESWEILSNSSFDMSER